MWMPADCIWRLVSLPEILQRSGREADAGNPSMCHFWCEGGLALSEGDSWRPSRPSVSHTVYFRFVVLLVASSGLHVDAACSSSLFCFARVFSGGR